MIKKSFLSFILLIGCAHKEEVKLHPCELSPSKTESRHLIIAAKLQASSLSACFKNYIKFEENKNQSFNVCHKFNVSKVGEVTYSKAYGINQSLPKDFEMCLEQQIWMMNFKGLQLQEADYINFSLKYQSKTQ